MKSPTEMTLAELQDAVDQLKVAIRAELAVLPKIVKRVLYLFWPILKETTENDSN